MAKLNVNNENLKIGAFTTDLLGTIIDVGALRKGIGQVLVNEYGVTESPKALVGEFKTWQAQSGVKGDFNALFAEFVANKFTNINPAMLLKSIENNEERIFAEEVAYLPEAAEFLNKLRELDVPMAGISSLSRRQRASLLNNPNIMKDFSLDKFDYLFTTPDANKSAIYNEAIGAMKIDSRSGLTIGFEDDKRGAVAMNELQKQGGFVGFGMRVEQSAMEEVSPLVKHVYNSHAEIEMEI